MILGNKLDDSQVRIHKFFSNTWSISSIEYENGDYIGASEIFEMFGIAEPSSSRITNMVVAGASFDTCVQNPWMEAAEGFGLTEDQLSQENIAPTIISLPATDAWSDSTYDYNVYASDVHNDELCFGLSQFPEGMTINKNSGLISWKPTRAQIGNHPVEVTVADERGLYVTQSFSISVQDNNRPPSFLVGPSKKVLAEMPYRYDIKVDDYDGRPGIELLDSPEGMSFVANPDDYDHRKHPGFLSWTPTAEQVGFHEISVRAVDIYGATTTQNFILEVVPQIAVSDYPEGLSRIPVTGARNPVHPLDDASLQIGTPLAFERVDALDIVIDHTNNLIWEDSANIDQELDFRGAQDRCRYLSHAGIDDWRMPTRLELLFTLNHKDHNFIDYLTDPAFKYNKRWFWVSDRQPRLTSDHATVVNTKDGMLALHAGTFLGAEVRCVSGEAKHEPEFFKPLNQNVTVDRNSRLMWQDDEQVLTNRGTWSEALQQCEALDLAGHSDWRIPNYNESHVLMTAFDFDFALTRSDELFDYVPQNRYWVSSTTNNEAYDKHRAMDDYDKEFRFEYQEAEPPSTTAWYDFYQYLLQTKSIESFRCVRTYAEPVPHVDDPNQTINFGDAVTLNATSSSDQDGSIAAFKWTRAGDGSELGVTPILELSSLDPGTHEIQLTVTDNNGLSQVYPEPIIITVNPPPEIVIQGETAIRLGQDLVLDASASVGNGGIVSYEWTEQPTGNVVGTEPVLSLVGVPTGTWVYTLTATDANGLASSFAFEVTISEASPEAIAQASHTLGQGQQLTLDGSSSRDEDGQIVSFKWYDEASGQALSETSSLELAGLEVGVWTYRLEVIDDSGLSDHTLVTGSTPLLRTLLKRGTLCQRSVHDQTQKV